LWAALRTANGTDGDNGYEWTIRVQTAETYVELPNDVDIETAISKLKNAEASGHDTVPAELIK
jgi:hypothetical protein